MIKVLHVLGSTNLGGAESRIMDLYRHMDRTKIQFDFLVHMDPAQYAQAVKDGVDPEQYRDAGHYDNEIRELGGHIYALPRFRGINYPAYRKAIIRFFKEHNDYNVVQGHMTSTASIYLPIAKAYGLVHADDNPSDMIIDDEAISDTAPMVTVAHTRNAGVDGGLKGLLTKILRKSLPRKADFLFACSHLAGDETFGGARYTYIPNTIDTAKFAFNNETREQIRDIYDIPSEAIVIGNVARFNTQKNHLYLIEAFVECVKALKDSNSPDMEAAGIDSDRVYLMLCGDGPLRVDSERLAQGLGVSDRVIFTGNQSEVQDYYCAMDIFAFPSVYEGLPGVMVEAQASGLYCLMSDTITTDVLLTDRTQMMSIAGTAHSWGIKLANICTGTSSKQVSDRIRYADVVRQAGFDVNDQAEKMARFYVEPNGENLPG